MLCNIVYGQLLVKYWPPCDVRYDESNYNNVLISMLACCINLLVGEFQNMFGILNIVKLN